MRAQRRERGGERVGRVGVVHEDRRAVRPRGASCIRPRTVASRGSARTPRRRDPRRCRAPPPPARSPPGSRRSGRAAPAAPAVPGEPQSCPVASNRCPRSAAPASARPTVRRSLPRASAISATTGPFRVVDVDDRRAVLGQQPVEEPPWPRNRPPSSRGSRGDPGEVGEPRRRLSRTPSSRRWSSPWDDASIAAWVDPGLGDLGQQRGAA
jgi:hypothetical protein